MKIEGMKTLLPHDPEDKNLNGATNPDNADYRQRQAVDSSKAAEHKQDLVGSQDSSNERTADVRHDRVARSKRKLASGFYNNPANYGHFADKIICRFGI
jgi:hypothetical protein